MLLTVREDGSPQASLVTMGVAENGVILVSTYPERAKVHNIRKRPRVSMVVLSDGFGGDWVQVDGHAEVVDQRRISCEGEHREAVVRLVQPVDAVDPVYAERDLLIA